MDTQTLQDSPTETNPRHTQAIALERDAFRLREQGEIQKAFNAYDEAGNIYSELGDHLNASFCYSAAATCWNIYTGWQPLAQAASRNHRAASEAMKAGQYDYARTLFREAALLYEKEGDAENYSACFISSQHAGRKRSRELWTGRRDKAARSLDSDRHVFIHWKSRIQNFIRWVLDLLNDAVWGYGEKPFRTFTVLGIVIFGCALAYSFSGQIMTGTGERQISLLEGLYFSAVTITTVGFGDFLPTHWMRLVAVGEALLGITLVPLFLIGLTRRYLRMYR